MPLPLYNFLVRFRAATSCATRLMSAIPWAWADRSPPLLGSSRLTRRFTAKPQRSQSGAEEYGLSKNPVLAFAFLYDLCGFAALRLCGEKLAVTCLVTSAPRGFWCYKGKWNWKKAAFFTTNYTDFIGFHGEDACVLSNCGVHGFQMTPFRVLLGSVSAYGARRPRR